MPEFYTIFARKNTFCPNLGGGTASLPPVSYAYGAPRCGFFNIKQIQARHDGWQKHGDCFRNTKEVIMINYISK